MVSIHFLTFSLFQILKNQRTLLFNISVWIISFWTSFCSFYCKLQCSLFNLCSNKITMVSISFDYFFGYLRSFCSSIVFYSFKKSSLKMLLIYSSLLSLITIICFKLFFPFSKSSWINCFIWEEAWQNSSTNCFVSLKKDFDTSLRFKKSLWSKKIKIAPEISLNFSY